MKFTVCLAIIVVAIAPVNAANKDECAFACPDVERPICGSDGVTYSNKCYLSLASCKSDDGIIKSSDGECTTSSSSSAGSDTADLGAGDCDFGCITMYRPVTDDDGNTYSNECFMRLAKCRSKTGSTAAVSSSSSAASSTSSDNGVDSGFESSDCSFACPAVMRPVTDENGNTYSNECVMKAAKCREKIGGATTKPLFRGGFATIDV